MKMSYMQRAILLSTLSLSSAAYAQHGGGDTSTSVTLYGVLDIGAGRFKGAPTGVTSTDKAISRVESGNLTTSYWGLRGSEDLGDGLSAIFALESFLRNDTGQIGRSDAVSTPALSVSADPFWARSAWVGLDSRNLGRIRFGQITTALWISSLKSNPFGDSTAFSPINLLMFINAPSIFAGGTGWSNSVSYDSPTWSGLSFNLQGALGEGSGGRNAGGRLAYAGGPFTASFAYTDVKADPLTFAQGTTRSNTKNSLLALGYELPWVKLFAHLGRIKTDGSNTGSPTDNNVRHDIWELSALVPIGFGNILLGYGERKGNETLSPQTSRKLGALGYTYSLSKRTDLYALLRSDKSTVQSPPGLLTSTSSASGTSSAFGIRHVF